MAVRTKRLKRIKVADMLDGYFEKHGIRSSEARELLRGQLVVLCLSIPFFAFFADKNLVAAFAVGALLVTFNFFVLARLISRLVWVQKGAVFPLLLSFYSRLILTGLVLYLAIVMAGLSVVSVLLGLSTVVLTILIWSGRVFISQKLKEV